MVEMPPSREDAGWFEEFRNGEVRERMIRDISFRLRDRPDAATQLPERWQRAAPRPANPPDARPLRIGPPTPDLGRPYAGIGVRNLEARMVAFFAREGGTFIHGQASPSFYRRRVTVEFTVALPFSDDASWRHEGGSASRWTYAADHPSGTWSPRERPRVDAATQTDESLGAVARNYAAELADRQREERLNRGEPEFTAVEEAAWEWTRARRERKEEERERARGDELRRRERVREALRRYPRPPVFVIHQDRVGARRRRAEEASASAGARHAAAADRPGGSHDHIALELFLELGEQREWARRRVERFPDEAAARDAYDLSSGQFELRTAEELHQASRGLVERDGGVSSQPLPNAPAPAEGSSARQRPVGRMSANWGGGSAPAQGPPGPREDDSDDAESIWGIGPGRFG